MALISREIVRNFPITQHMPYVLKHVQNDKQSRREIDVQIFGFFKHGNQQQTSPWVAAEVKINTSQSLNANLHALQKLYSSTKKCIEFQHVTVCEIYFWCDMVKLDLRVRSTSSILSVNR